MKHYELRATLQKIANRYEDLGITSFQLADLGRAVDGYFEQPQWVSVADRLPPFGEPILVARRGISGKLKVEQGNRQTGGWWRVYGTLVKQVLYWMPMPAPPEEVEK